MSNKIHQTKINNDCMRLHFFKVRNSKGEFIGYEFVNMDKIFPSEPKYNRYYYFQRVS